MTELTARLLPAQRAADEANHATLAAREDLLAAIRVCLADRYRAADIARTLGISRATLYRWLAEPMEGRT